MLLCEDSEHERFFRRLLDRKFRFENYALVVAIDGDHNKLHQRLQQLDRKLEDAGLDKRGGEEMIVICVPARNIETWELWLCGNRDIDEQTEYKRRFKEAERSGDVSPKTAVESWFRALSEDEVRMENETLPSLTAGRLEFRRLDG